MIQHLIRTALLLLSLSGLIVSLWLGLPWLFIVSIVILSLLILSLGHFDQED